MPFVRYYLVPFDPQPEKQAMVACPQNLLALGVAEGIPPRQTKIDPRDYRAPYYIVKLRRDKIEDFLHPETDCNAIRISRERLSELAAEGVDVSGITIASSEEDVERRIVQMILGEDKTLSELKTLKPDETVDRTGIATG